MTDRTQDGRIRVLAVASGGGHWAQLMQLRDGLDQFDVFYATTDATLGARDGIANVVELPDANQSSGKRAFVCWARAWRLVRTIRPDVVVSTGAMPGLFCLAAGRISGARTVWIDSIANSERSSLSGSLARWVATLWLTQWEHMARPKGPFYIGSVI